MKRAKPINRLIAVPARSVVEAIESFRSGSESLLSTYKAMRATELIFATYESARRVSRIDLPLDIEDSPLIAVLESRSAASS